MGRADRPPAAFYCVTNERYFLGAVGMINSLRLMGHTEPVFVLDCGLRRDQRALLERETTVLAAPADAPPYLLKTIAPLRHPAEVMVLIDSDVIVTRPLKDPIAEAARGRIVAFEDKHDRFFAERGSSGSARPGADGTCAPDWCALGATSAKRCCACSTSTRAGSTQSSRTSGGRVHTTTADQDVLNAILATRVAASRVAALPERLAAQPHDPTPPFFPGLRVLDVDALRCAYVDGTEPYALHQSKGKPWLKPMYHGIYSRLLARLLLAEDVAMRVSERELPLRMRHGFLARVERKRVDMQHLVRGHLSPYVRVARRAVRLRTRVRAWRGVLRR